MPEPDQARLGSGRVRLDADGVRFTPRRLEAWRGIREIGIPYAEVASLVMTEPKGLSRGRMTVRLSNGGSYVATFGSGRLPTMRRSYREIWHRVRAARGEEPGRGP